MTTAKALLVHLLGEWQMLEVSTLQLLAQQYGQVDDCRLKDLFVTHHDRIERRLENLQTVLRDLGVPNHVYESHVAAGAIADQQTAMRLLLVPLLRDVSVLWSLERMVKAGSTDCQYVVRLADLVGELDLAERFESIRLEEENLVCDISIVSAAILDRGSNQAA
jgi:ferritin-like metal-binding protein YciE